MMQHATYYSMHCKGIRCGLEDIRAAIEPLPLLNSVMVTV